MRSCRPATANRNGDAGQSGLSGESKASRGDGKASEPDDPGYRDLQDADLGIRHATDVELRSIRSFWQYRMALGKLTLIAGDGKKGKSRCHRIGRWPSTGWIGECPAASDLDRIG
jgi:hypothetical protein